MADLFRQSAEWLAKQILRHAGREVHYRRGSRGVLRIRAAVGRTEFAADDSQGGVRIEHTDRDFLVRAEEFFLDGQLAEPMCGDLIEEYTDRGTFIYEVLPTGHPVWRYDDPHRQMIRIHAKLIERR